MAKSIQLMQRDTLLLFPGALGDFICVWPTCIALRRRAAGTITLVARSAVFPLLRDEAIHCIDIERREVADLFATAAPHADTSKLFGGFAQAHSWTGHGTPGFAERLARITGGAVFVHPFRDFKPLEHAVSYYARCAGVQPEPPLLPTSDDARAWTSALWKQHALHQRTLVVHAGSGSARKNWTGMAEIAARWRATSSGTVLQLIGPADEDMTLAAANAVVRHEPLDRVACVLQHAARYVGNDSGISHLAGVAGIAGTVLFGASVATHWAPLSGHLRVVHADAFCPRCDESDFCRHRLPVDRVWDALVR